MGRRHRKHEEHANHEAWAIPYGDLITLLLAFFVVMYAISSINEGKFRVLSDSLQAAFRGTPKTLEPIQVGMKTRGSGADIQMTIVKQSMIEGQPREMLEAIHMDTTGDAGAGAAPYPGAGRTGRSQPIASNHPIAQQLERVADELEKALQALVDANLVALRRHEFWLEVEVRTDILFASGVAKLSPKARPALDALAATLSKYPNPVRVEGHTDNQPISTMAFPSNWELSSARAASVVHHFEQMGISPTRLSVLGFGEYRPTESNETVAGRNANRRVVIVILAGDGAPAPSDTAAQSEEIPESPEELATPGEAARPERVAQPETVPVNPITLPSPAAAVSGTEPAPPTARPTAGAGIPTRE